MFVVPRPVVEQAFDHEVILLDLERDLYFSLNEVGRVIWSQIAAGASLSTMLEHLRNTFDVPSAELETDTREFLQQLLDAGLIERRSPTAPR